MNGQLSVIIFGFFALYSTDILTEAATMQRPDDCDRDETLFKVRHVYKYKYSTITSSSYVGATLSKSGSKVSCSISIEVPRKCEYILQLADCFLQERSPGGAETYVDVDGADEFVQELQRYSLYFQMKRGKLIKGSIVADNRETLTALNMKRAIISAIQLQILSVGNYNKSIEQTDIFGTCPTKYNFSSAYMVLMYRNLLECDVPHVYKSQMNSPFTTIRPVDGGFSRGPLAEGIYPFVSDVTCSYKLNNTGQQLEKATCLQQQYLKPFAHHGSILATVMSNISQSLVLVTVERKSKPSTDKELDGSSIIDVTFDFGSGVQHETHKSQLQEVMLKLTVQYMSSNFTYPHMPEIFGQFVGLLRMAHVHVLREFMREIFSCPDESVCTDTLKKASQNFFLNGLESCGTESCLLTFMDCLHQGHIDIVQETQFLKSLLHITHLSESVQAEIFRYCKISEKMICWLSLGSLLSQSQVTADTEIPNDSTLVEVEKHMYTIVKNNCDAEKLTNTEKDLNLALKTVGNIGPKIHMKYFQQNPDLVPFYKYFEKCLVNAIIPMSVKRTILHLLADGLEVLQFSPLPASIQDTLFTILEDPKVHTTIRALSFSVLMKTTDKTVVHQLVTKFQKADTQQLKLYMLSSINTLLTTDQPDIQKLKSVWKSVVDDDPLNMSLLKTHSQWPSVSKTVDLATFFKLPLAEMMGHQLFLDLIYDPSSTLFSSLSAAVNFFYEGHKYNLFEVSINVHGFEDLINHALQNVYMSPFQLYEMLKAPGKHPQYEKNFSKFQQDIVKAVLDIIKRVNHPKSEAMNIAVDLKVGGKNVMFISLLELQANIQDMLSKMTVNKPPVQSIIEKILALVDINIFKAIEYVSFVREMPTCSGLPLNMTLKWYGFSNVQHMVQSDILRYLANNSPTLTSSVRHQISFDNEVYSKFTIPVGKYHSSGLQYKLNFGSERGATFQLKYGYDDKTVLIQNPTMKKIQIDVTPILGDRNTEDILSVRGRMFLLHHSGMEQIHGNPAVETTYRHCTNNTTQMILGHAFCVTFVYPNVSTSQTHAYFPLSGPFHMTTQLLKIGSGKSFKFIWTYKMDQLFGGGLIDNLQFTHTAQGKKIIQLFWLNVTIHRMEQSMYIDSTVPELDFDYKVVLKKRNKYYYHFSNVARLNKKPILGYIFREAEEEDKGYHHVHFNISVMDASFDLYYNATDQINSNKPSSIDTKIMYYCSKDRPFLYLLHPFTDMALRNGDVSSIRLQHVHKTEGEISQTIHFNDFKLNAVSKVVQKGPSNKTDTVIKYTYEGVERSVHITMTENESNMQSSSCYDVSVYMDNDDFNVVSSNKINCISGQNWQLSSFVHYINKEDQQKRRRRSLKSIYEKFQVLEKEAANKISKLEDALFGNDDKQTGYVKESAVNTKAIGEPQLPNMIPDFPSIWDLPEWKATLDLTAVIVPVFEPGTQGMPDGMEVQTMLKAKHPWNGGYRDVKQYVAVGKKMVNSLFDFKYWINGSTNMTYTSLDGTPVLENGQAMVVARRGHVYIQHIYNDILHLDVDYFGPFIRTKKYIMLKVGADGCNEILGQVHFRFDNPFVSFLNYDWKEHICSQNGHITYAVRLSHSMLNMSVDTNITLDQTFHFLLHQYGSVSYQVLHLNGSYSFTNKLSGIQSLTSEIVPKSMPYRSLVLSISRENQAVIFASAIKSSPSAKPDLLTSTEVVCLGSSLIKVTHSWTPLYETFDKSLRYRFITMGHILGMVADHLYANLNIPVMDQTIPFTVMTPDTLMKQTVLPHVMQGASYITHVMANIWPLKQRRALLGRPGLKVPSKVAVFLQSMKEQQNSSVNPLVSSLQQMFYMTIRGTSYFYLLVGPIITTSKQMDKIIAERRFSFIVDTHSVILQRAYDLAQDIVKTRRTDMDLFNFKNFAAVFGRKSAVAPLKIMTFDGLILEISASQSKECSFLLATDIRNRSYSLVLTANGLTLLTSAITVTIDYNGKLYINDCKLPRNVSIESALQSGDKSVTIKQSMTEIQVQTTFGLTLRCLKTKADVCIVTLTAARNATIGLLGTNDQDQFTDLRMTSGQIANDINMFMSDYVLSGPESCREHRQQLIIVNQSDTCNENVKTACTDWFLNIRQTLPSSVILLEDIHQFGALCEQESKRCDSQETDICPTVAAFSGLLEKYNLNSSSIHTPDICKVPQLIGVKFSMVGQLDIVFVISQNVNMTMHDPKMSNLQYMTSLVNYDTDKWNQFSDVRIGVVRFAGDVAKAEYEPNAIWLKETGNRYFERRSNFNWDTLNISANGIQSENGILAIQEAAKFPFNPNAHKIIVLMIAKLQDTKVTHRPDQLLAELQQKGIVLNVFAVSFKSSNRRFIGFNWDGTIITKKSGFQETKPLSKNDYTQLLQATKGALWDCHAIFQGNKKDREEKVSRIVEEFISQTSNNPCSAA